MKNLNKYYAVCIIGLSVTLAACDGVPEVNSVNCSGRGMEKALTAFKNNEAERQAFIDQCNALKQED